MRRGFGALFAAGALLAAGCGGGGGGGVPPAKAELPNGASVVPSSAFLFVSVDTSFRSAQWRRGLALFRKFPVSAVAERRLRASLHGLSLTRDVEPALGPELDIVLLDHAGEHPIGLTKPRDPAKLRALLATGRSRDVTAELGGWTLFASSRDVLDRFKREARRGKLAAADAFKDTMGRLDARAAVRVYVRGKPVQEMIDSSLASSGAPPGLSEAVGRLTAIGAGASAERTGVRVEGLVQVAKAPRPNAYTAELPKAVPADALLYVSFNHLDLVVKRVLKVAAQQNSQLEEQLSQLEAVMDISLSHDIYPLLSHEGGIAVYRGAPIPTIVFLLRLKDEARAKRMLSRVVTIAEIGGSGGVKTNSFVFKGVQVDELDFSQSRTRIFAAVFADKLVVANDQGKLQKLIAGGGATLADDPEFKRVQSDSKMPQRTLGFVYANLRDGIPAAFAYSRRTGGTVTPAERANTKPLRAALLYATRDGDRYALTGFLAIK